jgi:23S rRNA pseudouridine1911/1915/1917 synthase
MQLDDIFKIYESQQFLVLNKPCGIAVEAKEMDIIKFYKERFKKELHSITRLDQQVSGAVLFAKGAQAAAVLSLRMQQNKISKTYTAVVEGRIPENISVLEHKLVKKGNKSYVDEKGQQAITKITDRKYLDNYTRITLEISTGRFHQIRAQLSAIGYPIKGDLKYGSKRSNKEGGIYLHCNAIMINDKSGELRIFDATFPEDKTLYSV